VVSDFFFRCSRPHDPQRWKTLRSWFRKNGLEEASKNPGNELFSLFVNALGSGELTPHGHWHNISERYDLADKNKPNINQLDGLTDPDGNIIVTEIIKLEELTDRWSSLQREIKKRTGKQLGDLPHKNKIRRPSYQNLYNDESRNTIGKLFEQDIEYFKYTF